MNGYHYLMGMIELEKENYPEAIELIKRGISLLTATDAINLLYTESLGQAYFGADDLENAQKTYEIVSSLTTGKMSDYSTAYAISFYMLGKIFEEMDYKGKAIEDYEKFLDFWKDADPIFPEVEDAKTHLKELKN
jgi:tetratricopeptide (TPR) repeat protein